jgi:hypothetical protein
MTVPPAELRVRQADRHVRSIRKCASDGPKLHGPIVCGIDDGVFTVSNWLDSPKLVRVQRYSKHGVS